MFSVYNSHPCQNIVSETSETFVFFCIFPMHTNECFCHPVKPGHPGCWDLFAARMRIIRFCLGRVCAGLSQQRCVSGETGSSGAGSSSGHWEGWGWGWGGWKKAAVITHTWANMSEMLLKDLPKYLTFMTQYLSVWGCVGPQKGHQTLWTCTVSMLTI